MEQAARPSRQAAAPTTRPADTLPVKRRARGARQRSRVNPARLKTTSTFVSRTRAFRLKPTRTTKKRRDKYGGIKKKLQVFCSKSKRAAAVTHAGQYQPSPGCLDRSGLCTVLTTSYTTARSHRAGDEGWKLVVVPNQHKHVGAAERCQHSGLRYLPGFIHHAVVETPAREKWMLHAQARAAHNP